MSYGFHHEGLTYFPDGSGAVEEPASNVDARNRATSAQEVEDFRARTGDRWFAYVKEAGNYYGREPAGQLTTWMGDFLADFWWAGHAFRCTFGDIRRNLRARGIDGRAWYGTAYLSSGDYARIRVAKSA